MHMVRCLFLCLVILHNKVPFAILSLSSCKLYSVSVACNYSNWVSRMEPYSARSASYVLSLLSGHCALASASTACMYTPVLCHWASCLQARPPIATCCRNNLIHFYQTCITSYSQRIWVFTARQPTNSREFHKKYQFAVRSLEYFW